MNLNTLIDQNINENIDENIFECDFIPNHKYPYLIQLYNLFSFKYLNKLISPTLLALFSISRTRRRGIFMIKIEYTAIYNIYYQYYSFDNKKFITYNELLNYILTFN
jgi:hypothetical protein